MFKITTFANAAMRVLIANSSQVVMVLARCLTSWSRLVWLLFASFCLEPAERLALKSTQQIGRWLLGHLGRN
jgi:hypothetical protein